MLKQLVQTFAEDVNCTYSRFSWCKAVAFLCKSNARIDARRRDDKTRILHVQVGSTKTWIRMNMRMYMYYTRALFARRFPVAF